MSACIHYNPPKNNDIFYSPCTTKPLLCKLVTCSVFSQCITGNARNCPVKSRVPSAFKKRKTIVDDLCSLVLTIHSTLLSLLNLIPDYLTHGKHHGFSVTCCPIKVELPLDGTVRTCTNDVVLSASNDVPTNDSEFENKPFPEGTIT